MFQNCRLHNFLWLWKPLNFVSWNYRVSSEKEKSFRENLAFFATISLRFRISFARKKCEISLQSVSQNNGKSFPKKIIRFHKFFWAINCCSYKTNGFHEIFAKRFVRWNPSWNWFNFTKSKSETIKLNNILFFKVGVKNIANFI